MGRNYSLQIVLDEKAFFPEAKLTRGKFCITTSTRDQDIIRQALESWYKNKAKEKINERIKYYQGHFHIKLKKVIVKSQEKRWGSCTRDNKLLFNWKCLMAP